MISTFLDAKTYGVGELITHRKLLRVPEHQRDYAWTRDDVNSFVEDLSHAFSANEEYFIGLFVLVGPRENIWEVLDGQQRLATVTLLYAAIRDWLSQKGFNEDADQVEKEFLGVRQLGGQYSPRLTLNSQNSKQFCSLVLDSTTRQQLVDARKISEPKSSQQRLFDAALTCRKAVVALAKEGKAVDSQAARLFSFASFLEKKVKVVCLDVSSAANAYVIFESLNDRGHELSVWDLVRNYLFGQAKDALPTIRRAWEDISNIVGSSNADDFLKVFWTSQFGRVQRGQLFEKLRSKYDKPEQSVFLAQQLQSAARMYSALDEVESEVWGGHHIMTRHHLANLQILGTRQARPVLLAGLQVLSADEFESLLKGLIAVFVRYQTIGQRRTGQLEIKCAQVAREISAGELNSARLILDAFRSIVPPNAEFVADFEVHAEPRDGRCAYLLSTLERTINHTLEGIDFPEVVVDHICPPMELDAELSNYPMEDTEKAAAANRLGNKCIIEAHLASRFQNEPWPQRLNVLSESVFVLTRAISEVTIRTGIWRMEQIEGRQSELANIASMSWSLGGES